MSFQRYHAASFGQHSDDDLDDDIDLSLEELDPISNRAARRSSSIHSNPFSKPAFGQGSNRHVSDFNLNRLRPGTDSWRKKTGRYSPQRKEVDEDARGLLEDANESSGSLNAGLQHDDNFGAENGHEKGIYDSPPAAAPRQSGIKRLITKLKSSPQSQAANDYGTSASRSVQVGQRPSIKYPPNVISNAKYSPWSFLPLTLYNEFRFFFNLYFLLVALSQVIPALRIGVLSTYIAPLAFVLMITLGKEAFDDVTRRRRDAEANAEKFTVLDLNNLNGSPSLRKGKGKARPDARFTDIVEEEQNIASNGLAHDTSFMEVVKPSKDLKVGDIVKLTKDQRVPADAVILRAYAIDEHGMETAEGGEAFIRTDQLDGETDWKLRIAPALSQNMSSLDLSQLVIEAGKPTSKVNEFVGAMKILNDELNAESSKSAPLGLDNTAWANTVIASSGFVLAVIIYTGSQTRQSLSTSSSRTKTGLLEFEINNLTKILCALTLFLAIILVALESMQKRDELKWYISVMRYLILFSTIVPISLRVNLDMGKAVYAWFIEKDADIAGTVVRTSTIPEDLGRIEYLLSDKTGTLTQNDMFLRKIHVGTVAYANEAMLEVTSYVKQGFGHSSSADVDHTSRITGATGTRSRREIGSRVRDLVLALALCHNVTPTIEEEHGKTVTNYQASSPDEIAIVKWAESVGLRLHHRDRHSMVLFSSHTNHAVASVEILNVFPFTSEGKRMGIIVKFEQHSEHPVIGLAAYQSDPIWFFQKGADTVMSPIVAANDWLDEETANMAREGLRTLVVGRKRLTLSQYTSFAAQYRTASVSMTDRDSAMAGVVRQHLEHDLELLGVTGVEDKLQKDVKPSLELLRNAGIKIWMLTGDKVETARCVAISSKLVARGQYIHTISKLSRKAQAQDSLDFLRSKPDACLLIDGESLALMLEEYRESFISTAVRLSAVVACRCSPTQKADVASLIRAYTKKRVCCIGDGGNDVSMIQAADVGVGIVGKEGNQASLAADFSILQFCYLTKLLVWHGRNSYKRSAKLAQFVMHRGLIISICQTVFSITNKFVPDALYRDWLLVGYATVYTMMPVFSLVLDKDIPAQLAHLYPELYAELSTSRSLSYKTFLVWVAISVYQGCAIQLLSQLLVVKDYSPRMVSVSYTALILNELVMVAAEVTTWHWVMVVTIVGTAGLYFGSLPFLGDYFDLEWILKPDFWWRVAAIAGVSLVPVYGFRITQRCVRPESYRKVQQGF